MIASLWLMLTPPTSVFRVGGMKLTWGEGGGEREGGKSGVWPVGWGS